jgi:hypothetical protein
VLLIAAGPIEGHHIGGRRVCRGKGGVVASQDHLYLSSPPHGVRLKHGTNSIWLSGAAGAADRRLAENIAIEGWLGPWGRSVAFTRLAMKIPSPSWGQFAPWNSATWAAISSFVGAGRPHT